MWQPISGKIAFQLIALLLFFLLEIVAVDDCRGSLLMSAGGL